MDGHNHRLWTRERSEAQCRGLAVSYNLLDIFTFNHNIYQLSLNALCLKTFIEKKIKNVIRDKYSLKSSIRSYKVKTIYEI